MVGFHFGLFGRIKIANFFVQPELLFTSSGGQVKVQDITSNTETIKNQTYNKIDIPVLAGLKFGPARIEVGPVASFMLITKIEFFRCGRHILRILRKLLLATRLELAWIFLKQ